MMRYQVECEFLAPGPSYIGAGSRRFDHPQEAADFARKWVRNPGSIGVGLPRVCMYAERRTGPVLLLRVWRTPEGEQKEERPVMTRWNDSSRVAVSTGAAANARRGRNQRASMKRNGVRRARKRWTREHRVKVPVPPPMCETCGGRLYRDGRCNNPDHGVMAALKRWRGKDGDGV